MKQSNTLVKFLIEQLQWLGGYQHYCYFSAFFVYLILSLHEPKENRKTKLIIMIKTKEIMMIDTPYHLFELIINSS
jgi:hypothetical protein